MNAANQRSAHGSQNNKAPVGTKKSLPDNETCQEEVDALLTEESERLLKM